MRQTGERDALRAEIDARRGAYFAALRAGRGTPAAEAAQKEWDAFRENWARRAAQALRRAPDAAGGLPLAQELWIEAPGGRDEARRILSERYAADPAIGNFCANLALDHEPAGEALLRRIRDVNPDRGARALATLALGERILGGFGVYSEHPIPKERRAAAVREARAWLTEVVRKYAGAAKVYGAFPVEERARRRLSALRNVLNLEVGKVAPPIEGEDLDGVRFRLADYRGTVVMLDFWGHW